MVKKIKTIAIIQARLTSKRFPSKVLKKIGRLTSIQLINERLKLSKCLNDIVFSIPNNIQNKKLESHLIENKIKYYKGSENNVVSRFLNTAKKFKADNIVRVTADCPLVDPKMLDQMLHNFKKNKVDYLTNSKDPLIQNDKYSYPDGFDLEIFKIKCLEKSIKKIKTSYDKEHVTTFIRNSKKFKKKFVKNNIDLASLKLSIDTKKNLEDIRKIYNIFYPKINFSFKDVLMHKETQKILKKNMAKKKKLTVV